MLWAVLGLSGLPAVPSYWASGTSTGMSRTVSRARTESELGEAQVGSDFRGERGARGLFGEEFGVDGWRLPGLLGGSLAECFGVALLPFLCGVEVDEGDGG